MTLIIMLGSTKNRPNSYQHQTHWVHKGRLNKMINTGHHVGQHVVEVVSYHLCKLTMPVSVSRVSQ
eukprot:SAG31_NODE_6727_length_1909_cov_1.817127_2_plen_66_part_00